MEERYLFDQGWALEQRRLDTLGALYDQGTFERLSRLGVGPGARCLEVGAGSGTVARWMAAQAGPAGKVVATDLDARFLAGLGELGVEVRQQDIAAVPLERGGFDVIHTRAVLQHVPRRDQALANMIAALAPGGRILVEDIVMPHPAAHPPLPTWGVVLSAMEAGLRRAGADPYVGLQFPTALAAAGLVDVGCDARVPVMQSGTPTIEFVVLSVEQVGPRLVEAGALAAAELDATLAALRAPGHTMTAAIMIASWGTARG
jgi:SAM-dependent methyltransferase